MSIKPASEEASEKYQPRKVETADKIIETEPDARQEETKELVVSLS